MKVEMRRNRLAEYLSSPVSPLTRQEVFAVMLAEGWYGERGFGTFQSDFRYLLDSGTVPRDAVVADARKLNQGRTPSESTVKLREWLATRVIEIHSDEGPVTVRRIYYVVLGEHGHEWAAKSERFYAGVSRELTALRKNRTIPYECIAEAGHGAVLNRMTDWTAADCIRAPGAPPR